MDINYRILWFEDTVESFDALGRRTKRYVESQNLRCTIDRLQGVSEFDSKKPDINSYEILVVDLKLSEESKGYSIIETIRQSNFVNDILFYSSDGVAVLESILKEHRLEGVFITDRKNDDFMFKIQQLIDKSIRRSENVINIRGIVLDETSEFDTLMCDIINTVCCFITEEEIASLKKYMSKALKDFVTEANKLLDSYGDDGQWDISNLLAERDFNSMMKAKTLNYVLKSINNPRIIQACNQNKTILPAAYNGDKICFVKAYNHDIIVFRNKLAHVKNINTTNPALIGEVDGKKYYCDKEFCAMMRDSLIKYEKWLTSIYNTITQ